MPPSTRSSGATSNRAPSGTWARLARTRHTRAPLPCRDAPASARRAQGSPRHVVSPASQTVELPPGFRKTLSAFCVPFQSGRGEIAHGHHKKGPDSLVDGRTRVNGRQLLDYGHFGAGNRMVGRELSGDVKIEPIDNGLSVVKGVHRNTPTDYQPVFAKMMRYCERMPWYRRLSEGNTHRGITNGDAQLTETLCESGRAHDFERYPAENKAPCRLVFATDNGAYELIAFSMAERHRLPSRPWPARGQPPCRRASCGAYHRLTASPPAHRRA